MTDQQMLFECGATVAEKHCEQVARDEALAQVAANAGERWQDAALRVFDLMPEGEMTGEDIRLACKKVGVAPHHHNAWGSFVMARIKSGRLVDTGRRTAMKAEGSHARKTTIYRKVR